MMDTLYPRRRGWLSSHANAARQAGRAMARNRRARPGGAANRRQAVTAWFEPFIGVVTGLVERLFLRVQRSLTGMREIPQRLGPGDVRKCDGTQLRRCRNTVVICAWEEKPAAKAICAKSESSPASKSLAR